MASRSGNAVTEAMPDKQGQGYLGVGKSSVADEQVKSERDRSIDRGRPGGKVGIVSHSAESTQTSSVYIHTFRRAGVCTHSRSIDNRESTRL